MHRKCRHWDSIVQLGCAAFVSLATLPGYAQSAGNKAAAEAIFEQGKLLMQSGEFTRACEKFDASRKLDEGIGTTLYLADCYEKVGHSASAWAMFREAASMAGAQGQESRQKLASQRATALESILVKLTVEVARENGALLGFEVRIDGTPIPPAQFGTPVPIDPGEHRLEASAPGRRTFSELVNLQKGHGKISISLLAELAVPKRERDEQVGAAVPVASASTTRSTAAASSSAQPTGTALPERSRDSGNLQRASAYILGGLGVVGIGIGSYYGLSAISKNGQSEDECPSNRNLCTPHGVELREDAISQARISTLAFAVGGAALTAGVVLFLTAPNGENGRIQLKTAFGPNLSQLKLEGRF